MSDRAVTYGAYLAVDELLALQRPRSEGPEHDELLFIVIHQVYELWFKEILHEIDEVMRRLEAGEAHRAQHTMKRVLTILKVMVAQLDILETMTPLEFLSFRTRLEAASGFQSDQFRQLEFVLGHKSPGAVARFAEGSRARAALEARHAAPTLWDAFVHYLAREGYDVPPAVLAREVTAGIAPSDALQETLVRVYRSDPKNAELCERLVDLDEGLQEWRYRHVKMVQRTIGTRAGAGARAAPATWPRRSCSRCFRTCGRSGRASEARRARRAIASHGGHEDWGNGALSALRIEDWGIVDSRG
ncbi:MAG: tryptophan 2,3-dioxygenase family protein [Vicinamibacterales bacterium]